MNTNADYQPSRKLPSIDWIALAIGVLGLALSRIHGTGWGSWIGLLGLAVFGPPLLRELGVLKDEDEYTRNIRWRAGFHAILVVAIFVFLNKTLYPIIAEHPDAISHNVRFFPIDFLRQSLVLTFLFSYLIQYWGAPDGVFRIMLGIAGLTLLEFSGVWFIQHYHWFFFLIVICIVTSTVVLAYYARVNPRLGGFIILFLGIVLSLTVVNIFNGTPLDSMVPGSLDTQLGILRSAVQIFMVFGAIGLSLVKSGTEN